MKKLLRVMLPPLTGFIIYFLLVRFNTSYFSLRIDEMGEGTLRSFMAFFKYLFPLFLIIAILTQLLIINPIWRNIIDKAMKTKLFAGVLLVIVCMLFATGITYAITDTSDTWHHRLMLLGFMTLVQLAYWVVDLGVLLLLN